MTTTVVYLHDTQERLELIASHPGTDDVAREWVERKASEYLGGHEVDSEARVVTAHVVESIDVGDFIMRGPTPAATR